MIADAIDRHRLAHLLEQDIDLALAALASPDPTMEQMARFHLGMLDELGKPTPPETRAIVQGKRMRPTLAMLSAMAVGGTAENAAPIAAAIELLHNFTLIHDDIMDRSPNRRHRPTVWRIWGDAQAINAGDALFAASQLAALRSREVGLSADTSLGLLTAFNRCTIDIVRGQVSDLRFEGRDDVTPADYLEMIRGKTSAIVRFAAWAGAIAGGADTAQADRMAEVGLAIGLGFQIRDDMLGIWATAEQTGKDAADDIRRRKQSLPILILRSEASPADTERIHHIYAHDEVDENGITDMLTLLDAYDVASQVNTHVIEQHDRALAALKDAVPTSNAARDELARLITSLATRTF